MPRLGLPADAAARPERPLWRRAGAAAAAPWRWPPATPRDRPDSRQRSPRYASNRTRNRPPGVGSRETAGCRWGVARWRRRPRHGQPRARVPRLTRRIAGTPPVLSPAFAYVSRPRGRSLGWTSRMLNVHLTPLRRPRTLRWY